MATVSLWAAEKTLSEELLQKYFKVERVVTENEVVLEKTTISGPPTPPLGFERPIVQPKVSNEGDINSTEVSTINTMVVPAYNWSFGCTATSAAMLAGYYDRNGYANVYTGPTGGGVAPLDNSVYGTVTINGEVRNQTPLSATRNGLDGRTTRGHVDDYWVVYGDTDGDPWYGNWTEHTYGSCTADYMKTNQWYHDIENTDGSTHLYSFDTATPLTAEVMEEYNIHNLDGAYGMKLFFESRGYVVDTLYTQKIDSVVAGGFSFAQYMAEIDAGHPVMINVTGHTMLGVGYDSTSNTIYLHDTWDYSTHTMTWGDYYSGMLQLSVSVIHISGGSTPSENSALPAIISYLLSDSSDSSDCVVGNWNKIFDWDCDGTTGLTIDYIRSDGTFSAEDGYYGTWTLTENTFKQIYSSGTIYTGIVDSTCNYITGTMIDYNGVSGCWDASRVVSSSTIIDNTIEHNETISADGTK